MSRGGLQPYAYVLAVRDFAGSVGYFERVLGFRREWNEGDNWQALARGGVRLMLGRCPEALPVAELGDHSYFAYLEAEDLDGFHAEIAGRGAIVLSPPADKPWGRREMAIATPEGHRIMVAQTLD